MDYRNTCNLSPVLYGIFSSPSPSPIVSATGISRRYIDIERPIFHKINYFELFLRGGIVEIVFPEGNLERNRHEEIFNWSISYDILLLAKCYGTEAGIMHTVHENANRRHRIEINIRSWSMDLGVDGKSRVDR